MTTQMLNEWESAQRIVEEILRNATEDKYVTLTSISQNPAFLATGAPAWIITKVTGRMGAQLGRMHVPGVNRIGYFFDTSYKPRKNIPDEGEGQARFLHRIASDKPVQPEFQKPRHQENRAHDGRQKNHGTRDQLSKDSSHSRHTAAKRPQQGRRDNPKSDSANAKSDFDEQRRPESSLAPVIQSEPRNNSRSKPIEGPVAAAAHRNERNLAAPRLEAAQTGNHPRFVRSPLFRGKQLTVPLTFPEHYTQSKQIKVAGVKITIERNN